MIRVALRHGDSPPRVLSEDEFIREIEQLEAAGFATALPGPVSVEAFDGEGRVCWRAYYASMERLTELAKQLAQERKVTSRT